MLAPCVWLAVSLGRPGGDGMIFGIGTDIVAVKRMADYWQRHGERGL